MDTFAPIALDFSPFQIDKDVLRIGKVTTSPFSDDGKMTVFFHAPCMFES
jgi:DNA ligase 3